MAAPIEPHEFVHKPGDIYCQQCQLPRGNKVHTVQRERTRIILTLDHEATVTPDDLAKAVTETFAPYRDITLYDMRILP